MYKHLSPQQRIRKKCTSLDFHNSCNFTFFRRACSAYLYTHFLIPHLKIRTELMAHYILNGNNVSVVLTVCAKWNQYPHEDTNTLSFAYTWTDLYPISLCREMQPLLPKKINENYFCLWEILITLTFAFSFFLFFFEFTDIFRDSGNRLIIPFTTSKTTKQISQKYFILFSCLFPLEWARAGWSWSIIFVFFFNF